MADRRVRVAAGAGLAAAAAVAMLGVEALNAIVPAAIYLLGVGRVEREGGAWPRRRTAAFLASLAGAAAATSGVADSAARGSLAWHMAQQMTLLVAVPPVLLAGRPGTLLRRALGRDLPRAPGPAAAWCLFVGLQWILHAPPVLAAARAPALAALMHWALVLAGVLFFAHVFPGDRAGRLHPAARAAYLLSAMPTTDAIALWLVFDPHVVYAGYGGPGALTNQRLAGMIMFAAGTALLVAAGIVAGRWLWQGRAAELRPATHGR